MLVLLGGSGYRGQAYQHLLTRKGITFRNIAPRDLDYTQPAGSSPCCASCTPSCHQQQGLMIARLDEIAYRAG